MIILTTQHDLNEFLYKTDCHNGCLADTGFLYGVSYDDDRIHIKANQVLDLFSDYKIPLYSNVISRMEFADLIFRKILTLGAVDFFESYSKDLLSHSLFNLLKDIRDKNSSGFKNKISYKLDESRIKRLRSELNLKPESYDWTKFCTNYVGQLFENEWTILEEELGLNFVETLENQTSEFITKPLVWKEMVSLMGQYGLRSPDAMILNMFVNSTFKILITTDSDFLYLSKDPIFNTKEKAIYLL